MNEVKRESRGLYRPEFEHDNCGIGAVVNIKGKKTHDTVANALKIVEHLEHRAGKDAEGKTGTAWVFFCRSPISFSKKPAKKKGLISAGRGSTGSPSSSSPSMRSEGPRREKCSRSLFRKKGLSFWAGEPFLCSPAFWDTRQRSVCPASCRRLSKNRRMWKKGSTLTADFISPAGSLNRATTTPMWYP